MRWRTKLYANTHLISTSEPTPSSLKQYHSKLVATPALLRELRDRFSESWRLRQTPIWIVYMYVRSKTMTVFHWSCSRRACVSILTTCPRKKKQRCLAHDRPSRENSSKQQVLRRNGSGSDASRCLSLRGNGNRDYRGKRNSRRSDCCSS